MQTASVARVQAFKPVVRAVRRGGGGAVWLQRWLLPAPQTTDGWHAVLARCLAGPRRSPGAARGVHGASRRGCGRGSRQHRPQVRRGPHVLPARLRLQGAARACVRSAGSLRGGRLVARRRLALKGRPAAQEARRAVHTEEQHSGAIEYGIASPGRLASWARRDLLSSVPSHRLHGGRDKRGIGQRWRARWDAACVQVRRVLDTIRGRSYEDALILMEYMPYRACEKIVKALISVRQQRVCGAGGWMEHHLAAAAAGWQRAAGAPRDPQRIRRTQELRRQQLTAWGIGTLLSAVGR